MSAADVLAGENGIDILHFALGIDGDANILFTMEWQLDEVAKSLLSRSVQFRQNRLDDLCELVFRQRCWSWWSLCFAGW